MLLLCHPEDIEAMLVNDRDSLGRSNEVRSLQLIFGDGLISSQGELWRRQRRLIQPKFERAAMQAYAAAMVECIRLQIEGWHTGEVRNLHLEMMQYTRDVVCRTLFGSEPDGDANAIAKAVITVFSDLRSEILYLPLWRKLPLPRSIRWNRAVHILNRAIRNMISNRRASRKAITDSNTFTDMLTVLLDAHDVDGTCMSDQQVHDEIMTMFLAGHETSALSLTWAIHLLAVHPEIQERAAHEVLEVTRGRDLRAEDYPNLRYLAAVVQEILRLYPPVWSIGRSTTNDTALDGAYVGKGTHIWLCTYKLHRDSRWYSEPEAFIPERWLDGTARRKFTYLPFGAGPRMCIGQHFATAETVLGLAAILSRFRLTHSSQITDAPEAWITLRPKQGLPILIEAR